MFEIETPIYKNSDLVVLSTNPFSWFPVNGPVYIISMSELTNEPRDELKLTIDDLLKRYKNEKMRRLNSR